MAEEYLKSIASIRAPVYVPIILLGNKRDLEVGRQVTLKEGRTLALKFGSQFFEVSSTLLSWFDKLPKYAFLYKNLTLILVVFKNTFLEVSLLVSSNQ